VRGSLVIDKYININFKNYTNFFMEIHDYDESFFDIQTGNLKKYSENYVRSHSCTSLEQKINHISPTRFMFSPIPV
jgi:hypothetical protein